MLELLLPQKVAVSPYRKRLDDAGIKGGWNYALDHAWLFEKIDGYLKARAADTPIVLDVGCGNSMLHTFLEQELHLGIIGIDRIFGKCPFNERDFRMDICVDFTKGNTFFKNSVDVIYWCSSIEHNTVEEMKLCVRASMEALKPGGLFLATFGYAPKTHYFQDSECTNLCAKDAEDIFGERWHSEPDFNLASEGIKQNHFGMYDRYKKRYSREDIVFVVGAAEKIKK